MSQSETLVTRETGVARARLRQLDPVSSIGAAAATQRPTVLLADDEPLIRRICRQALATLEVSIVEAENGTDAIKLWEEAGHGFEAAVLDFCMPGATGIQVLQHMRRTTPELPAVFISGTGRPEDCASFGNIAFLDKPFKLDDLRRLVREAVGGVVSTRS